MQEEKGLLLAPGWHTLQFENCLTGTRVQLEHASALTLADDVRMLASYGHHQTLSSCGERLGAPFFVALTEERKGRPPQESQVARGGKY